MNWRGVSKMCDVTETVLRGSTLSAGRDSVFSERNEAGLRSRVFGSYFDRKPRMRWNLGAKRNRHWFEDSHLENSTPRSGTLFPIFENVK